MNHDSLTRASFNGTEYHEKNSAIGHSRVGSARAVADLPLRIVV